MKTKKIIAVSLLALMTVGMIGTIPNNASAYPIDSSSYIFPESEYYKWYYYYYGGSTTYESVDDRPHDGDSTYIWTGRRYGEVDFNLQNISITHNPTISVEFHAWIRDVSDDVSKIVLGMNINGSDFSPLDMPVGGFNPTTSFTDYTWTYPENPVTSTPWTNDVINNTRIWFQLLDTSPVIYVTSTYLTINLDYNDPPVFVSVPDDSAQNNTVYYYHAFASDYEDDSLAFAIESTNATFAIVIANAYGQVFAYLNHTGTFWINISVTDGFSIVFQNYTLSVSENPIVVMTVSYAKVVVVGLTLGFLLVIGMIWYVTETIRKYTKK